MKHLLNLKDYNGNTVVSARDLYEFLEVKTEFKDWMPRMLAYGFIEGTDFSSFLSESTGGRPSKEFVLSIDCAKEISMLQRTEKGKEARLYFIECEKRLRNPVNSLTRLDIAKMLLESEEEKLKILEEKKLLLEENAEKEHKLEEAQKVIQIQAPKVLYVNQVLDSPDLILTNVIAKELGMSAVILNKKLQQMGVQYKQDGTWLLKSKYQDKGYTKTKTHTYLDSEGKQHTNIQTYWTQRGRAFIHNLFNPLKKVS